MSICTEEEIATWGMAGQVTPLMVCSLDLLIAYKALLWEYDQVMNALVSMAFGSGDWIPTSAESNAALEIAEDAHADLTAYRASRRRYSHE